MPACLLAQLSFTGDLHMSLSSFSALPLVASTSYPSVPQTVMCAAFSNKKAEMIIYLTVSSVAFVWNLLGCTQEAYKAPTPIFQPQTPTVRPILGIPRSPVLRRRKNKV